MANRMIDILTEPLKDRKDKYGSTDIGKLIIDGNEFTGYKTFSSYWEKTYVEQPERSESGVIDNLDDYPTFNTFIVKVNFAMMSIEDYRRLYNLILSKNEFVVTAYNVLTNSPHTCKMYFAPDQMPKLYAMARAYQGNKFVEILGVQDYTIELIQTGNSESVNIACISGSGDSLSSINVEYGSQYALGQGISVPNYNGRPFNGKWGKTKDASVSFPTGTKIFAFFGTSEEANERTIKWYAQYY